MTWKQENVKKEISTYLKSLSKPYAWRCQSFYRRINSVKEKSIKYWFRSHSHLSDLYNNFHFSGHGVSVTLDIVCYLLKDANSSSQNSHEVFFINHTGLSRTLKLTPATCASSQKKLAVILHLNFKKSVKTRIGETYNRKHP